MLPDAGYLDGVRSLLSSGTTPLHLAAILNKVAEVKALILAGANFTAVDSDERTPLHCALVMGSTDVLEPLLAPGATPFSPSGDFNTDVVRHKLYYRMRMVVNHQDKFGRVPMDYLEGAGHLEHKLSLLPFVCQNPLGSDEEAPLVYKAIISKQFSDAELVTMISSLPLGHNPINGETPLLAARRCDRNSMVINAIRERANTSFEGDLAFQ